MVYDLQKEEYQLLSDRKEWWPIYGIFTSLKNCAPEERANSLPKLNTKERAKVIAWSFYQTACAIGVATGIGFLEKLLNN